MRAFDDLVRGGKVLYIGICNASAWMVAKSNTLAELRGWTRYVGLQIEYNLLERTVERELIPMARDQSIDRFSLVSFAQWVAHRKISSRKQGRRRRRGPVECGDDERLDLGGRRWPSDRARTRRDCKRNGFYCSSSRACLAASPARRGGLQLLGHGNSLNSKIISRASKLLSHQINSVGLMR